MTELLRWSGRWRIVGWMMTTLALALAVVVVVVRSVLLGNAAEQANSDVTQELREFTSFVENGVDPRSGQGFDDSQRLLETYLQRQQVGPAEVMMGWHSGQATAYVLRGPRAPSVQEYDFAEDPRLHALMREQSSGILDTPAGPMRWGRTLVDSGSSQPDALVVGVFTGPEVREAHETVRTLTLVSLAALALAGVVSWAVAGRILRPVRLVRQAAARITEHDLTQRIPVTGHDEVSGLAVSFNEMLDRLEEAFAVQRRFVDDAGHELRTPITVVRGHLELMGDDPAERQQTVALVTQELDRMARLVTDLLALAKADRPDFVVPQDDVDVTQLTLDLDAKIQHLSDRRRWQLSHIAEGTARLDAQRVTQAVLQLADNAVQHTLDGDAITLMSRFATEAGGERVLQIAISDTGGGIEPQHRERIFDRFVHGLPADGTRHAGAGLGLPIVKAICEAHRGRVQVDSPPGQGATFTLVIPAETRKAEQ